MGNSDQNQRQDAILQVVVRAYVDTAEPVGSRTIAKHYDIGLSPASIRNVMADLEEEGYLTQPHTSAGRTPTDKGYRYFVDHLMEHEPLGQDEKKRIFDDVSKERTIEGMAIRASKIVSEITQNAALIYFKSLKRISLLNRLVNDLMKEAELIQDLFEEDSELFIEGTFRIFDQPEFQDAAKIKQLLRAFDEKVEFLEILLKDIEEEGVQIHIGTENEADRLEDVSLIVKDCYSGDLPIGGVALVGPTRMNYSRNISVVDFVADLMTDAARRF